MKQLFTLLMAVFALTAYGQEVNGLVKDTDGNPIDAATITLYKDSSVVKLAVTNKDGIYKFEEVQPGTYRISVSHVNFKPVFSQPFQVAESSVTVDLPQLEKMEGGMQAVVVTARKPLIEVKADKTIMNVEGTINAEGNDALELLRRSPGVTIDKDDNLSLAGKNGVQVYIDNRPTPLSGQDLANYLKSLQSSQVEAIEIITNPSAKYEAAGNAGIINIRLKKNKAFGTNGSATAGWQVGRHARYNGSLNLNHRNKNINVYGTYGINRGQNGAVMEMFRQVGDSTFNQLNEVTFEPMSHNFKVGMDYSLSTQSSIGAIVNGSLSSPKVVTDSRTDISQLSTGTLNRVLIAGSTSEARRNNYNINLNYMYNGKDGKSLNLNADKGYFDNNNDQYQPNIYFDPSGQKMSSVIYRMISPTLIDIYSLKADYEQNLGKGKLGVGGKTAFVNTDNDFKRYDVINSIEQLDRNRSNRFKYDENINAGYINYNYPFTGFMIQAGLRVENTISKGISTGEKMNGTGYENVRTEFKRDYLDFFPSAAMTFNKNPMNQWSLSYSRRIDRPGYQNLNPFEFKLDEYTSQRGNTNLQPQYTNSFSLSNTYRYKLNTSLNYSHVSNLFTQIIDTTEGNKAFITQKNLATQDVMSFNISYPFMYKTLTVFANINTNYSLYQADFGNNRKIDANAFGLSAMTQASYKFAKTWTAELMAFYNAPTIYQGTFKASSLWMMEAGMQKQLFGGKGTLKASMGDVFNSMRFSATSDFAGQKVKFSANPETQMFKLNFTLRFGSNTVKGAKQRTSGAEEELKRAQQSDGGIGPVKQ